jgi:DNA-binding transcriptional ArsR family regulator
MRRDVFQAIADPTRRQIIDLIAKRPLNVNAVSDHFDISRPAVSKHVKILAECGLITIRQEGRERFCDAQLHKLKEVATWTESYKTFWNKKLTDLEDFLAKEKKQTKKR